MQCHCIAGPEEEDPHEQAEGEREWHPELPSEEQVQGGAHGTGGERAGATRQGRRHGQAEEEEEALDPPSLVHLHCMDRSVYTLALRLA